MAGSKRGFTLVEALMAMIIFTLITSALTLALSTALNAHTVTLRHQEQTGTVRAVFGAFARDLQAAHASSGDSASLFVASNGGGGSQNSGGGSLLTLTTLSHTISAEELNAANGMSDSANTSGGMPTSGPQSSNGLVRYTLDPQSGMLVRTESAVPNTQASAPESPTPQDILATGVENLTLRFWDGTTQSWRDSWDFEQPNLPQQSGSSGSSSSGQQSGNSSSGSGSGDATLPGAVEITLTMRVDNRPPVTYSTMLPVVATQPLTPSLPDTAASSGASSGTGTGTGGAGQGGSGTGGQGGGTGGSGQ